MTKLDPKKIERKWVDHFIKIYGMNDNQRSKENAAPAEKVERLEQLAKDRNTPTEIKKRF